MNLQLWNLPNISPGDENEDWLLVSNYQKLIVRLSGRKTETTYDTLSWNPVFRRRQWDTHRITGSIIIWRQSQIRGDVPQVKKKFCRVNTN